MKKGCETIYELFIMRSTVTHSEQNSMHEFVVIGLLSYSGGVVAVWFKVDDTTLAMTFSHVY